MKIFLWHYSSSIKSRWAVVGRAAMDLSSENTADLTTALFLHRQKKNRFSRDVPQLIVKECALCSSKLLLDGLTDQPNITLAANHRHKA